MIITSTSTTQPVPHFLFGYSQSVSQVSHSFQSVIPVSQSFQSISQSFQSVSQAVIPLSHSNNRVGGLAWIFLPKVPSFFILTVLPITQPKRRNMFGEPYLILRFGLQLNIVRFLRRNFENSISPIPNNNNIICRRKM